MKTMKTQWTPKNNHDGRVQVLTFSLDGSDNVVFSFSREYDRNWVLRGCPWHFEKALFTVTATYGKYSREDMLRVPLQWQLF